jgi:protein arginine kinase
VIDEKLDRNDVVICSRIRLARNIAEFPFVSTCSDDQRAEIESTVRAGLTNDDQLNQISFVDSVELGDLERRFLLALQLVSAASVEDTLPAGSTESTLPDASEASDSSIPELSVETLASMESASLTINEEDHLRITVTRNDLDLSSAWDQINQLDDRIEQQLHYAFSPRWGYLTACPANVGTGMRVSVLVHLPALAMTGQIDQVFRSLQRINVVVRGVFSDKAVGDFYRISNQATLGVLEKDLIEQVAGVIPALVQYERQAREFLLTENREGLRRAVALSLEQLCKSDLDDDSEGNREQIMTLLSKVRMGVGMGLLGQNDANRVNRLFGLVQLRHRLLAAITREDYRQASKLRDQIEQLEQGIWDPRVFEQDIFANDQLDEGDSI